LPGGRGAYRWRGEVLALGEDALCPAHSDVDDVEAERQKLLAQLAAMTPQDVEADVYQLWEGTFCRYCRFELGRIVERFLSDR
jgi:hypothetical protein